MRTHQLYIDDLKRINQIDIPWKQLEGKTILITGGTGLIGTVLVDSLIYRNEMRRGNINLWVIARNSQALNERFERYINKPYFNILIQDICDKINISTPIDFIIHGASKGDPYSFATDPVGVMNANYMGMHQVLELGKEKKTERILYISSGEVYGIQNNREDYGIQSETEGMLETDYGYIDILNPRSCYASAKKASETMCTAYSNQYGLYVNIARPCHTYGSTMLHTDNRVIGEFIRNALQSKDIIMKSEGIQKRSYCYVADTVAALLTILLRGENNTAYNIANKKSIVTIRELAEMLAQKAEVKVRYEKMKEIEKRGYSNIMNAVLDASKLEGLGWQGKYGIQEGIDRTLRILM